MATKKPKRKRSVKVTKTDKTLPKHGFQNLYYIDTRAKRIVQGSVETINTIHKPVLDNDRKVTDVIQHHYYTLRVPHQEETVTVFEEYLFVTQEQAAKKLGSSLTDYLK